MALTKNYTAADGRVSPEAYAVIHGERYLRGHRRATLTLRVYHSRAIKERSPDLHIQEMQLEFNDQQRFDVDPALWHYLKDLDDQGQAAKLGIPIYVDPTAEEPQENDTWEGELAAWRSSHPFYSELFGPGRDADQRKTVYEFLKAHTGFADWNDA